ncbi:MAG: STAS-like domain-containing protein [Candidatus Margulisiibacteriota bacterium]|jgi:hypothetical protein
MNNIKEIKLNSIGLSLGTREIGGELREKALIEIKNGSKIHFNFNGITMISSAFADELFGKLFEALGEDSFKAKIRINNFDNEEIKNLVLLLISNSINFRKNNLST